MTDKSPLPFLDIIDSQPEKAFEEFYRFAKILLTGNSPQSMRILNDEDREELIDDTVMKCYVDDWKVLRKYSGEGKSLSGFLYVLAHNAAVDRLRNKWNRFIWNHESNENDFRELSDLTNNNGSLPDNFAELSDILATIRDAIAQMGEHCRMLLLMASEEYTPLEIVEALKLPEYQNKKISDSLRECRKTLKNFLSRQGIDIDTFLNNS